MKTHLVCKRERTKQAVEIEPLNGSRYRVVVGDTALELDVQRVAPGEYSLIGGDRVHDLLVAGARDGATVHRRGEAVKVQILDEQQLAREAMSRRTGGGAASGEYCVTAPMPGRVVKCLVGPGDAVQEGQGVIIVEAMKMENELRSAVAGTVRSVAVAEGADVEAGQRLALIDAAGEAAD